MKLEIKDLSLLKIDKIKDWAIYFTYDNEKYLLHGSSDGGDSSMTLYLRVPIGSDGKYKLEPIHSKWASSDYVSNYIKVNKIGNGKSKTIHYSEIDKEFFIKQLTNEGFVSGILDKKVDAIKIKNKSRQEELRKLREQMWKLERQIKELEE
jgi:hypothetical protein